jgi:DNA-binding NtrC family response regulator/tetratricopeptide (TPR) repeat protein
MKIQDTESRESGRSLVHLLMTMLDRRDFTGAVVCFETHESLLEVCTAAEAGAILHAAARAHASLSHLPIALRLARRAQASAERDGDSLPIAEIFMTIGRILRDLGEMREAEKAWRDAESIFRRNDHPEGQSDALNALAGLFFQKSDYRNAITLLMDAVAIATKLGDRQKLAFMMGNIGRIHSFTGDFEEAERHLKINIELSQQESDEIETERALLSLGYLHIQQRQYARAEQALAEAYQLIVHLNRSRDEVMYLTYLGELQYRMHQYAESATTLQKALRMAQAIAPNSVLDARVMRHLAELYLRQNDHRRALGYVTQALPIMETAQQLADLGALHVLRARIAWQSDQRDNARESFLKGLAILEESGVRWERAEALVWLGRTELFSHRERMTYLFRAEEFYMRAGVASDQDEVNRLIAELEIPAVPSTARPAVATGAEPDAEYLTEYPMISKFKAQIPMLGRSDLPLLLTGETGVGKDRLAGYYHSVVRPGTPFVSINCASLPETLLESELYGYSRGAFTGASTDKPGLMVTANGGVLVLDEIGDLPIGLQAKLLGVLEKRRLVPLGSTTEVELDFKLIAATNQDLELMVEQGRFRRDLYYRLSGLHFHIPPLRERKEDIPILLQHFMARRHLLAEDQKLPVELLKQFVDYDWPGNIRELENKVKRLEVMAQLVAEGDMVELARSLFGSEAPSTRTSLFDRVEQFERQLIMEALTATNGNKCEAARLLGVHEATVRLKLKRYLSADASAAVN